MFAFAVATVVTTPAIAAVLVVPTNTALARPLVRVVMVVAADAMLVVAVPTVVVNDDNDDVVVAMFEFAVII